MNVAEHKTELELCAGMALQVIRPSLPLRDEWKQQRQENMRGQTGGSSYRLVGCPLSGNR